MRKLLLGSMALVALSAGSAALAADLPVKAPVYKAPPPVAAYNWAGFYVGVNAGYAWSDPTVTFAPNDPAALAASCGGVLGSTCPPSASFNGNSGLGGFQAGYNWQVNQSWLLGFEADIAWTSISGTGTSTFLMEPVILAPGTSTFQASEEIKWFGTVRGRLGWLPISQLLVYGTGGFAYGRVNENIVLNAQQGSNFVSGGFGFSCSPAAVAANCFAGSSSRTATGWTAGAGFEYALWNNISVKAEYLYVNLGHVATNVVTRNAAAPFPASFTANYSGDFHVIRAGLNYKFGGPIVANY